MIPAQVDVWWADTGWLREDHLGLLTPWERGRPAALRRAGDRCRSALGAVLLRLVAARELGVEPPAVPVDRTCARCSGPHGPARLPGSGLHVSVTHSGRVIVVATTRAGPVGVDVERVRDLDHQGMSALLLAPGEPAPASIEAFFTTWTRKESVVKATGGGLCVPLSEVRVSPPHLAPRLLSYRAAPLAATVRDLAPGAGDHVGALTVLAPEPVVVDLRSAAGLLLPGGRGQR